MSAALAGSSTIRPGYYGNVQLYSGNTPTRPAMTWSGSTYCLLNPLYSIPNIFNPPADHKACFFGGGFSSSKLRNVIQANLRECLFYVFSSFFIEFD